MKKKGGKATKYVPGTNLDLVKGEVLLPGRHVCLCEATKHALINNCTNCGRIVCEQEGSGPCFSCGKLVCTPKEQELIIRQSKTGFKLYNKLMNQSNENAGNSVMPSVKDHNLQSALEHRDKLLEYDRTVEKRTKVIDDENDYFQIDSKWLSAKEREILKKKKEEVYDQLHNRQQQKLTFDFAGRKIVEEKSEVKFDIDELLNPGISIFECKDSANLDLSFDFSPVYIEENSPKRFQNAVDTDVNPVPIRIQDSELQKMSDGGMCLSVHQPFASLLTSGIKRHEGRVWYTSYRGRLWIHSAGKEPTLKEISAAQNLYNCIVGNCKFPDSYPAGCLLGCVDLVDCLPQEEYKYQYPHGEIESPYVLICENAQELTLKFPMKGLHKIFQLDSKIHQAAKKTLKK